MDDDLLRKVEALARSGALIDLATVGADGVPHVSVDRVLEFASSHHADRELGSMQAGAG